jgi:hypothetical protein
MLFYVSKTPDHKNYLPAGRTMISSMNVQARPDEPRHAGSFP